MAQAKGLAALIVVPPQSLLLLPFKRRPPAGKLDGKLKVSGNIGYT